MNPPRDPPARQSRWLWRGGVALGALCLIAGAVWLAWDWNWFRPLLEARLSAVVGRPITLGRLEVQPGRITSLTIYNVKIANPVGFEGKDFATAPQVNLTIDAAAWWHTGRLVLPAINVDHPDFNVVEADNGQTNLIAALPVSGPSSGVEIGDVEVNAGTARFTRTRDKSDVTMTLATGPASGTARNSSTADHGTLTVEGKGRYAGQPITLHAIGGTVLRLADTTHPYPVDVSLVNGETRISLKGRITDPTALKGADLRLILSGSDMSLLFPLLGIATPRTPTYNISGKLDFADGRIKFTDIVGKVGSSDIGGELEVDPHGERQVLTGSLVSHQVDLADLGGFVGSTPGRVATPNQTPRQIEEVKRAEASPKLLPTTPISAPKARASDVHLTYRGEKIIGEKVPFESIDAKMDIVGGHIHLSPLRVGIGGGAISGTIDLLPVNDTFDASADMKLEHVDIGKLLASAGLGDGRGSLDGTAKFKGRGSSLSTILAHGDGTFHAVMPTGGNINAMLVDLLGLELGNAFFAAIGIPREEAIRCALADLTLRDGVMASRALEVNTTDHVITGGGRVDLAREVLELTLRADPKHFTIAKLATAIVISGPLKDLHFAPAPELAARGGAALALGLLFPPAAILPTIQFGVGEGSPCAAPGKQRAPG